MIGFFNILLILISAQISRAFNINARIPTFTRVKQNPPLWVGGGQGWGNDDFLSSLGGSEEDRVDAKEQYEDFRERRENFNERQRERMESPAGQKFMKQQQEQMMRQQESREALNRDDLDSTGDFFQNTGFENIPMEGQSRFARMQQASGSRMTGGPPMGMGFEQKLAIPLDADDEDIDNDESIAN